MFYRVVLLLSGNASQWTTAIDLQDASLDKLFIEEMKPEPTGYLQGMNAF